MFKTWLEKFDNSAPGKGWERVLNKCPYPFLYHFSRKCTPLIYLLLRNGTPFTHLL